MSAPLAKRLCLETQRNRSKFTLPSLRSEDMDRRCELRMISPPITPETFLHDQIHDTSNHADGGDPVLYPGDAIQDSSKAALFSSYLSPEDTSLTKREDQLSACQIDDEELLPSTYPIKILPSRSVHVSCVSSLYNTDPGRLLGFLKKESAREPSKVPSSIPKSERSTKVVGKAQSSEIHTKRNTRRPNIRRNSFSRVEHGIRSTSLSHVTNKPAEPRLLKKRFEDVNFESLDDFAPPSGVWIDAKTFTRPDWPAGPLDLSSDPNRHLLNSREMALASGLRLSCATYLCSKRRIFSGKVDSLRVGREFRKTDAQQACKIDVNKASKLWQAFHDCGWFDEQFFRKYLNHNAPTCNSLKFTLGS